MNNILTNLINIKFYATKELAVSKVETCFAMNRITDTQYPVLVQLIDEKYGVTETTTV